MVSGKTRLLMAAALAIIWSSLSSHVHSQSPADRVARAVAAMDAWLAAGPNGPAWRKKLRYDEIQAQIAAGANANPKAIDRIRERFAGDDPGLSLPQFTRVRHALDEWRRELSLPAGPPSEGASEPIVADDLDRQADAAKARLRSSVAQLNDFLMRGGHGESWKKILHWNELEKELAAEGSGDLAVLETVSEQFSTDWLGLELPPFAQARRDLRRYLDLVAFSTDPDATAKTKSQIAALREDLKAFADKPYGEASRLIGRRLGFLARTGQATDFVAAIRRENQQPNLLIRASRDFLATGFEQPVDELTPVHDVILGTEVHGTGRTVGRVDLALVPDAHRGLFEIVLTGTTRANTVGYNGPVTIYSSSVTQHRTTKPVAVTAEGLMGMLPQSNATTDTNIRDISAGGRCFGGLIEKIAWRRAGQQQSAAEAEAARKAEIRAGGRLDQQAGERLAEANARFASRFRNPLLRRDQFPQILRMATNERHLYVTALQADVDQIGAPGPPPPIETDPALTVRMHESWAGNFAAALIAGQTLTDERAQQLAKNMTGKIPDRLQTKQDEDPWSITFARIDPLTLLFDDGGFTVTVRGRRFTSGDREFGAMNVTAVYKIQREGAGSRLIRQGELEIVPPDQPPGKPLTSQQVALRTLLRKKFDTLFEPEFKSDGLKLGGRWERLGPLPLADMICDNGWLVLGWNLPK